MREIRLSPSAMNDYQSCPLRYLYSYIYKLQREQEKDSLRIGTNWGRCHEIMGMIPQGKCPSCLKREEIWEDCYLCSGTGVLPADLMDAVTRYLDWVYENVPDHKTHEQWEVEKIALLYSFVGYRWRYVDSPFEIVTSEEKYELPIVDSARHKKIPMATAVGKLDHIVRDKTSGLYYVMERKSTSRSLTDSRYWNYLQRNVQTLSYLWASRICQRLGRLEKYGIKKDDPLIAGVHYDVWHKPDIAPRKVTKKEQKEFTDTGTYYGEEFSVLDFDYNFETPQMYGARLLSDIAERPEHYFARREFPISPEQLAAFERKQVIQAKRIRHDEDNGLWVEHEGSCETPFRCDFKDLCLAGVEIGPNDIPEGFIKLEDRK